jgi:hypothetical protein
MKADERGAAIEEPARQRVARPRSAVAREETLFEGGASEVEEERPALVACFSALAPLVIVTRAPSMASASRVAKCRRRGAAQLVPYNSP